MTQAVSQSSERSERVRGDTGRPDESGEDRMVSALERQTTQVPSDAFLWAAGASIGGSLLLHMMDRKQDARFVGQWAPTFLCLGIYNKIARQNADAHRY